MNNKPRRHRWITEAINQGKWALSVWPTEEEINNPKENEKFMNSIAKIGNDPRVIGVEKISHPTHDIVYVFTIGEQHE